MGPSHLAQAGILRATARPHLHLGHPERALLCVVAGSHLLPRLVAGATALREDEGVLGDFSRDFDADDHHIGWLFQQ